jgi:NAD(P)-dependent dehydrogenase (short-subunit alcohol dehydrogenase family)
MSLQGRIALVTGGGSGIGRATALRLAQDGADGVVLDLNLEGARETVTRLEKLGRRGVALRADVTRSDEVRAAVEQAARALGPIDVLVNNAGLAWQATFLEMPEQDWDRMLAVHLKGAYNCTRAVLPGMLERRWGRIVSLSSIAGLGGTGRSVAYATAKAALIGFTKSLAREVAPHGITVNAVAPGFIATPMTSTWPADRRARVAEETPVRREGAPEDIAHAIAYLASEEASFVTGQILSPNGGRYM